MNKRELRNGDAQWPAAEVCRGTDMFAAGPNTGLQALMLAVLEDGIGSYLGAAGVRRSEAEAWVASEGCGYPFAFRVVCETLGLAPEAVRAKLWRWRREKRSRRSAIGRSRPNVRYARWLVPVENAPPTPHASEGQPATVSLLTLPTGGGGLDTPHAQRAPLGRRA
jgi:hypothetical protein